VRWESSPLNIAVASSLVRHRDRTAHAKKCLAAYENRHHT
jgi:hypothetical protein